MKTNQSATKNYSAQLIAALLILQVLFCATTPTKAQTPPPPGTYFSMQLTNVPPMPFDPLPDLDIYADPSSPAGTYFYDDRSVDYSSDTTSLSISGFATMSADEPAPPGDGSGGYTNSVVPAVMLYRAPDGYTPCVTWTNFWLLVSNDSSGVTVTISNTLPGLQYVLLQKQTLSDPSWTTVQTVTATGPVTQCSTITPGTNSTLFFQAKLTNYLAPVIVTPPTNVITATGGSATFSVIADGSPAVSYQWFLNGTNISGATTSAYSIGSAQASDAGLYTVVVSNAICTATAYAYLGLSWSQYLTNQIASSPAVNPVDGTIYITTLGSELLALDPITGITKWSASVPTSSNPFASSPAVASDGSAVYVGGSSGNLYAFSANGSPLWTHYTFDYIYSSPAVSATDGTIYITLYGGYEATLRAVNPITGATNWTVTTRDISPGGIINGDSSPAIAQDGTIYFLTRSARLYAVHPDGSIAWFFVLPTDDSGEGSPAIDAEGNILIGSKDGYLYCISHEGGLRWIFNTSLFNGGTASAINASPSIGPDSTIYIASQDGNIYAITNGGMKWKFTATNSFGGVLPFLASPTVTSSNVVFVGTSDSTGGFYGIADGIQKAPFHSTAANVYSSAAIDPFDGGIIVADMGGYIYKFPGVGDLPANAPWPMFHRTPSHAGAVPDATIVNGGVTAFPNNPTLYPQTGTFTFNLTGTPSIGWEIYASSNLVDWTPIGSALVDKYYTWTDFEDSEIGGVTTRFYQARSPYGCSQIIGFTLQTFGPQSTNLVANPFYQVNDYQFSDTPYPQNTAQGLTTLMADLGFDDLPQGVQIGKWYGTNFDSVTWQLNERSWSSNGDLSLLPGKSFFIINPSTNSITVPFVGNLAPGTSTNRISVGTNYVSALFPKAGRISTDLGFMPNDGDQVILLRTNGSFTSSYSSSTGWSPSEPSIAIAEGFVLNTTQSNTWINYSLSCSSSSNLFIVPAKPVWTDTGLLVTNGDTIVFPAVGAWNGRVDTVGPEGGTTSEDTFVSGPQFSLVAFVGPDPYKDAQGTNRWTENNTYFPLTAEQNGGTNGYWLVGTNGSFTTDRSGKLWFGFNDDGQTTATNDNYGEVYGELQIVHP